MLPVTCKNDKKTFSEARHDLRKQHFFHKDYDPRKDDKTHRVVNNRIYVLNSKEPDFEQSPEVEPSVNHFLLSQTDFKPKRRPIVDSGKATPNEHDASLSKVKSHTQRTLAKRTRNNQSEKPKEPVYKVKINYGTGEILTLPWKNPLKTTTSSP